MRDYGAENGNIRLYALDLCRCECALGFPDAGLPRVGCHDELRYQAVVRCGDDRGARATKVRVQPYAVAGWEVEGGDLADGERPVGCGVLGCDAELDGVGWWWCEGVERCWESADALCEEELGSHEVGCGEGFGDGVLDLEAGIDLEEVVCSCLGIQEELEGSEGHVINLWYIPSAKSQQRIYLKVDLRFSPCELQLRLYARPCCGLAVCWALSPRSSDSVVGWSIRAPIDALRFHGRRR